MGATTRIAWADSTFNPWWGCTKVSPACDFCYAASLDHRYSDVSHWGSGVPRRRTGEHNWNEPRRWNRIAEEKGEYRPRVFCMSMGDWADNEVPDDWRNDLWKLIRETPYLRWMLLTKRIANAFDMLPDDFETAFRHVGIMSTVINQYEANRDIPRLLRLKTERNVRWVGISAEPMLSPMDLAAYLHGLDWVIIGGESESLERARPFVIERVYDLKEQCQVGSVAVFIKQLGRNPTLGGKRVKLSHKKGEDQNEWPDDLRVQQYPPYLAGSGFPVTVPALASPEPNLFTEAAQ
jgi:protein gp37